MKRFIVILMALFLIIPVAGIAKDMEFEFEWNANTEPDMAKYNMFHRVESQGYDYLIPIHTVNHPTVTANVPLNVSLIM